MAYTGTADAVKAVPGISCFLHGSLTFHVPHCNDQLKGRHEVTHNPEIASLYPNASLVALVPPVPTSLALFLA